jgi:hypothetical protein
MYKCVGSTLTRSDSQLLLEAPGAGAPCYVRPGIKGTRPVLALLLWQCGVLEQVTYICMYLVGLVSSVVSTGSGRLLKRGHILELPHKY